MGNPIPFVMSTPIPSVLHLCLAQSLWQYCFTTLKGELHESDYPRF
jgi:hypothetical protein